MEASVFAGEWQGFVESPGGPLRVEFRVTHGADGHLTATVDSPDQGELNMAVEALEVEAGRLTGVVPFLDATFRGRLSEDSNCLALSLTTHGQAFPVELRRDHPAFRTYRVPRLDQDGTALLAYQYQPPETVDDGWQASTLSDEGLDEGQISSFMQAILDGQYPQAHSVILVKNGRLVLEEYFYGHHRERRHGIQSCTKSITSIVCGLVVDQGFIESVDQLVYPLFPERRGRRWIDERYDITLRHVLTMQAGLDWDEEALPYTDPRNDATAMNLSGDWIGYVLDRRRAGPPGERYAYTSGLSILLGGIIRNATGQYVDEFAARHLFGPLGITDFAWDAGPDGTRHTGGGLALRPRDAAKLASLMLAGGIWNERRILSEQWARESTRRQTRPGDYGYGYQWHLHTFEMGGRLFESFCAKGYGGQYLFMLPAHDLAVVFTAGAYGGDSRPYEKMERWILPAIR
jgi:CubicO group peptidase (beta-lactamase class C family)